MSQNPYAQNRVGGDDFSGIPTPSRMSVLAVIALVCGILGCLPGLSLIAILLGVVAIFLISASKGRVRGTGLAIGGVVLGLIFTGIYIFVVFGALSAAQEFNAKVVVPAQASIQGIEKGDKTPLRQMLSPSISPSVTDAQIDQFTSDVKAEFGAYKSSPNSLMDLIGAIRNMKGAGGPGGGKPGSTTFQNSIPWPMEFEKSQAFLLLEMDVSGKGKPSSSGLFPIVNIGLVRAPDMSKEIWLLPRGGALAPSPTPGGPGPGTPSTPPASPSSPPAPASPDKPDEKKEPGAGSGGG